MFFKVLLLIVFQRLLVGVLVFDVTIRGGCVRAAECDGENCFCGSL